jgi:N-acetylglucosaminyl-diphospho-decaprenol L-rhamnosyltransferase
LVADRFAVVTVSFRSEGALDPFLSSLAGAAGEPASAVVVVDNAAGSGPSTEMEALRDRFDFLYVAAPDNPGYGGAVNRAVRLLSDDIDWVVVANPDVEFRPAAIATLIRTAKTDARIAAVGPAVLNEDGSIYPSARKIPSLRNGIGHVLFVNAWPSNPWSRAYRDTTGGERRDAGWLSGSCLLLRRSAFEAMQGFDDGYFMYFEDVDLGYRFGQAGLRNVFEPDAAVTHSGAHSTSDRRGEMLRAHHRSARRFLRRKYRGRGPVGYLIGVGLGVAIRVREAWTLRGGRHG